MTFPEIYNQLKLVTEPEWLAMKELLSEDTIVNKIAYIKTIDLKNPKAIDFLFTAVVEDDYNGRTGRQYIPYEYMNKHSLFRIGDIQSFLENLPTEFVKYLPTNITARLRKIARDKEVESNTKQLQLNEFSYQMFKAQLQTAKKKLSGNEAVAQIQKLPNPTDQQQKEYYDKFLALFWEHLPKKSIDFCTCITSISKYTQYAPIRPINGEYLQDVLNSTEFNQNEVMIGLYSYQKIAKEYNIPVIKELYTDVYSAHHDWVTGVSKSTPLTQAQLEMTVSQIIILNHIITNLQGNSTCPYFKKMLAHLLEEVHKPVYKEQLAELHKSIQTSYNTAVNSINLLG